MVENSKKIQEDSAKLVDALNRALRLEYTLIIHYPRLASRIQDEDTRQLVQHLGMVSNAHADVVSGAISQLGGDPDWSFDPFPDDMDTFEVFQAQMEKEIQARDLHREAANLAPSGVLAEKLASLAKDEEAHIRTVERILSRLGQL